MDYKVGDIVSIRAEKVKSNSLAGCLKVKVIKYQDGLHFKPFLIKQATPIPIAAIDYFDPTWLMDSKDNSHLQIEEHIIARGLEHYEVLWAVISNFWSEPEISLNGSQIR